MSTPTLTAEELRELTGYRQHRRQFQWITKWLKITPPIRADGLPVVSRAQVEAGLAGRPAVASRGPQWSKINA